MSSPAATSNPAIDRVIKATTPGMSPKEAAVYAADIVSRSGTSFAAGMKILSRERPLASLLDEPEGPLITDDRPRRRFARMAASFFGKQPATIAAVIIETGCRHDH